MPGCNRARGADGDNNAEKFGKSRKPWGCDKHPSFWTSSPSLFQPPEYPIPFLAAVTASKPRPASADMRQATPKSLASLRVKQGPACAAVRLNKDYCPEIDVACRLAEGTLPSRRLQLNFPDLFPQKSCINKQASGDGQNSKTAAYESPPSLIDTGSILRYMVPSIPWRYLRHKHQDWTRETMCGARPVEECEFNTSPRPGHSRVNGKSEMEGHKEVKDAQCQTVCHAEIQTEISGFCRDAITSPHQQFLLSPSHSVARSLPESKTTPEDTNSICQLPSQKNPITGIKDTRNSRKGVKGKRSSRVSREMGKTWSGIQRKEMCNGSLSASSEVDLGDRACKGELLHWINTINKQGQTLHAMATTPQKGAIESLYKTMLLKHNI